MKTNFIMIPKDLIYDLSMNEKRIILYSYFATKRSLDNTVGFSGDAVVKWCGYSNDYHKNKTNDIIAKSITTFQDAEYMTITGEIIHNNHNEATILEKFDGCDQFALVYIGELEKIRNFKKYTYDKNRMSSAILILVLSYLRVNMLRRQEGYFGKESDKPEFCYRLHIKISTDIGLSSRYISRAIKILCEMDIIATSEMPRYKDDTDNWHTDVTLFVNKYRCDKEGIDINYNYQQEIEWGIEYIKKRKYSTKQFNQNSE